MSTSPTRRSELDLRGNRLRGLPKDLSPLGSLARLDVSGQKAPLPLGGLLAGLATLPALRHLSLDLASIGDLQTLLAVVPRLETVNGHPARGTALPLMLSSSTPAAAADAAVAAAAPAEPTPAPPASDAAAAPTTAAAPAPEAATTAAAVASPPVSARTRPPAGAAPTAPPSPGRGAPAPQRPAHAPVSTLMAQRSTAALATAAPSSTFLRAPQPPPIPLSSTAALPALGASPPPTTRGGRLTSPPGSARGLPLAFAISRHLGGASPPPAPAPAPPPAPLALATGVSDEDLEAVALLYAAVKELHGRLPPAEEARLTAAFDNGVRAILATLADELGETPQPPPASTQASSSSATPSRAAAASRVAPVVDPFLRGCSVLTAKSRLLGLVAGALEELLRGGSTVTSTATAATGADGATSSSSSSSGPVPLPTGVRREAARLLARLRAASDALLAASVTSLRQLHAFHDAAHSAASEALGAATKEAAALRSELAASRAAYDEQGVQMATLRDASERRVRELEGTVATLAARVRAADARLEADGLRAVRLGQGAQPQPQVAPVRPLPTQQLQRLQVPLAGQPMPPPPAAPVSARAGSVATAPLSARFPSLAAAAAAAPTSVVAPQKLNPQTQQLQQLPPPQARPVVPAVPLALTMGSGNRAALSPPQTARDHFGTTVAPAVDAAAAIASARSAASLALSPRAATDALASPTAGSAALSIGAATRAPRLLSLPALHAQMTQLLAAKAEADAAALLGGDVSVGSPAASRRAHTRHTLEEQLYVSSAATFGGLAPLVAQHVGSVIHSLSAYAPHDAASAAWLAMLRNEVDEGFWGLHTRVRDTAAALLRVYVAANGGSGSASSTTADVDAEVAARTSPGAPPTLLPLEPAVVGPAAAVLAATVTGAAADGSGTATGGGVEEAVWGFIVRYMYAPADAAALSHRVWQAAAAATVGAAFPLPPATEAAVVAQAAAAAAASSPAHKRPSAAASALGAPLLLSPEATLALAAARQAHTLAVLRQMGALADDSDDDGNVGAGAADVASARAWYEAVAPSPELSAFLRSANPRARLPWRALTDVLARFQLGAYARFLGRFRALFASLDADGTGYVAADGFAQLVAAAAPDSTPGDVAALLQAALPAGGGSGGGRVSFSEAVRLLAGGYLAAMLGAATSAAVLAASSNAAADAAVAAAAAKAAAAASPPKPLRSPARAAGDVDAAIEAYEAAVAAAGASTAGSGPSFLAGTATSRGRAAEVAASRRAGRRNGSLPRRVLL